MSVITVMRFCDRFSVTTVTLWFGVITLILENCIIDIK